MTLDTNGQFITLLGRATGVYATKKRGRWQYRSESGTLYGSGMEPAEFVRDFWKRDDFQETSA